MTIRQQQCLLAYLGYYTGAVDGTWGAKSQKATEDFQRDYGMMVDGIFGEETQKKILSAIASGEKPEKRIDPGADWWADIRYFRREEFRCTCGKCGGFPVEPTEKLVRTVDAIREILGVPVSIVESGGSGVRCKAHNAAVGGVDNSYHLLGMAADLHARKTPAEMKAAAEAVMGNTGGIGLYPWGIHVDTGKYSRWNG